MAEFKSGFVGIIGRPNVGKSTLLNQMLGQKIAIMSDKAQTTRNKIHGVYTDADMQIIFMDTPGVHKPQHKLGEYMSKAALSVVGDVDVLFYLVDATADIGGGEAFIVRQLSHVHCPIFLIINKIDLLTTEELLPVVERYSKLMDFAEVVPVSAKSGNNVDRLLQVVGNYLSPGPKYYPDDMITDQPEQMIMAEIIREKVLLNTSEEVPHAVAVEPIQIEKRGKDLLYIGANIYVERESQKGILIGKGGAMLKKIGSQARPEIENLFGNKVFLELWVKVKKDWRNKDGEIRSLGYNSQEL